jgi:hypothetical protein
MIDMVGGTANTVPSGVRPRSTTTGDDEEDPCAALAFVVGEVIVGEEGIGVEEGDLDGDVCDCKGCELILETSNSNENGIKKSGEEVI